jgi:hypothetical protein
MSICVCYSVELRDIFSASQIDASNRRHKDKNETSRLGFNAAFPILYHDLS